MVAVVVDVAEHARVRGQQAGLLDHIVQVPQLRERLPAAGERFQDQQVEHVPRGVRVVQRSGDPERLGGEIGPMGGGTLNDGQGHPLTVLEPSQIHARKYAAPDVA